MFLSFCFHDEIFHLSWRDVFGRLRLSVRADSQVIAKRQYRFSEDIEVGGSLFFFLDDETEQTCSAQQYL
jgi:hypothetical protein